MSLTVKENSQGFEQLCDVVELEKRLAAGEALLPTLQKTIADGNNKIRAWHESGESPERVVFGRTCLVDQVLATAWNQVLQTNADICTLAAAGGYGRGELHPHSDVDLLILVPEKTDPALDRCLEKFLSLLWDIGLDIGHSVRTVRECSEEAIKDLTVITNLIESRWLTGNRKQYSQMQDEISSNNIWPGDQFFAAKLKEQEARHHRYHDTAYKLEPNVKESPGGLRDIQTIAWVTKRHFGTASLEELVERKFLTTEEFRTLITGQSFLWKVRNTLHFLANRREDRLLFDHQNSVAQQLGFSGDGRNGAIEGLMKKYYQTVMELNRLNEMLLQLFQEAILYEGLPEQMETINPRFQTRNHFLETVDDQVFQNNPSALLELFLILEQNQQIEGVRASTTRLVRSHLHLITDSFRNDPTNRCLFMEILSQPVGLTHTLRKMNQYGVLAAYLPAFAHIVGQMQYDLVHVYTVDEHTLFLIRNLRRFAVPEFADEFPLCSHLMTTLKHPERLHIAGLFHDIAKGRGGDHSELGAEDAREFCLKHGLSEQHTEQIMWLVRSHLLMSSTAQRRDISDPAVIHEFAATVKDEERLNLLYLLTNADIRATSPELWNRWKDSLLIKLHEETRKALNEGLETPVDKQQHAEITKRTAFSSLVAQNLDQRTIERIWSDFYEEYFLFCSSNEIVWHTRVIAENEGRKSAIDIQQDEEQAGTMILIYSDAGNSLFTMATAVLDQLGLSIIDARIVSLRNEYTLQSYLVLDDNGDPVTSSLLLDEIRSALAQTLNSKTGQPIQVSRQSPRLHRHFLVPTEITFSQDLENNRTMMELIATDTPGLLSRIAHTFEEEGLQLHTARIGTFGSRVEDVFYISDEHKRPILQEKRLEELKRSLIHKLGL